MYIIASPSALPQTRQDFYEDARIAACFLQLYLSHAHVLTEGLTYAIW